MSCLQQGIAEYGILRASHAGVSGWPQGKKKEAAGVYLRVGGEGRGDREPGVRGLGKRSSRDPMCGVSCVFKN